MRRLHACEKELGLRHKNVFNQIQVVLEALSGGLSKQKFVNCRQFKRRRENVVFPQGPKRLRITDLKLKWALVFLEMKLFKVYSKWSYAFLDLRSSECTCARKSTHFCRIREEGGSGRRPPPHRSFENR